jgi:fused signal recognition particle receptor
MTEQKKGWLARLREGLSRTSSRLSDGISGIFSGRKLDAAALEDLEDLLITSDLGVGTAARLSAELARTRFDKEVSADEIRNALAAQVAKILEPK